MTIKARKRFALDVAIRPAKFLFEDDQLETVQRVLQEYAPKWCEQARVWRSRSDQRPIDLRKPGVLEEAIREIAAKRFPLSQLLAEKMGVSPDPRFLGSLELRGDNDALTVVITADEYIFAPIAGRWIFGNDVAFQVRRSKVEGVASIVWCAQVFEALCGALSPLYGDAQTYDEFDEKNFSHQGGGIEAVGVDASRYLPGLYWLNFFGKPYRDLMGRERLLSAPAYQVQEVNEGVIVRLSEDPRDWNKPAYKTVEQRVLAHLGPQYFFSKDDPHRATVAPPFEFPQESQVTSQQSYKNIY